MRSIIIVVAAASMLAADAPRQGAAPGAPPPPASQPESQPAREKVEIAGEKFELEVAADDESRMQGLMDRERIEEHGGMLFIYPETQSELGFWMKNCLVEMDILYLDSRGRIVATHRMKVEPPRRRGENEERYEARLPRYPSRRPAQFAIELKAGTIERLKIKPGQTIELDVKRLAQMAE